MKRIVMTLVLVIAAATAGAQQEQDPAALIQAAEIKETVQNDLPGAIVLYERAVRASASDKTLAPKALFGLARAYERAGRSEARATYARLVSDYPDAGAAVATARARLAILQRDGNASFKEINLDSLLAQSIFSHRVSPDGRMIAYIGFNPEHGLFVRNVEDGNERKIVAGGNGRGIALEFLWSPNSEYIAFAYSLEGRRFEARIVKVSNGQITGIGSGVNGVVATTSVALNASWSPDSSRLILGSQPAVEGPWDLELVTIGSAGFKRLPNSPVSPVAVRWAPDGKYFTYRTDDPARLRLFSSTGDQTGVIPAVAPQPDTVVVPALWTPDNRVVFYQNVPGGNDSYAVPATGGQPRKICEGRGPSGGDSCHVTSPDGLWQVKRLVVSGGGRMVLVSTINGEERPLTPDAVTEEVFGGFSKDGRLFAFRSNREGPWAIYVVDIKQTPAARPVKVVQLESRATRVSATWTSRGLFVQMTNTQMQLYRVDVNATTGALSNLPVRVTKEAGTHVDPAVSPDGRRFAFSSLPGPSSSLTPKPLTIVDANGTNERTVATVAGILLGWRSESELLIGQPAGQLRWTFSSVDRATGQMKPVSLPPLSGSGLQYAPGTDEVFSYSPGGNALQITSLKTGTTRTMPMPATWFDYTVSKSGRLLSYSTAEERPAGSNVPAPGETRLRNLVTGDDRLLVKYDNSRDGNHLTVEFSWDDKSLIYAIPTGEWRVMDLETLKSTEVPKVQGLDVPLDGTEPSWSPDGKFVILGGRMPREALRFFEMTAESVARAATAGVKK